MVAPEGWPKCFRSLGIPTTAGDRIRSQVRGRDPKRCLHNSEGAATERTQTHVTTQVASGHGLDSARIRCRYGWNSAGIARVHSPVARPLAVFYCPFASGTSPCPSRTLDARFLSAARETDTSTQRQTTDPVPNSPRNNPMPRVHVADRYRRVCA